MPHSAISGSPSVCDSPELFAAYRGLPRLRVPRHPPHAFARLTTPPRQAEHARSTSRSNRTWRLGVSCASTSELFASPARPEACRRSRNCVTCVDSIDSPHAVNAPSRLTTTRITGCVGYPTITTSIRCQTARRTGRTAKGASQERRAPRRYGKSRLRQGVETCD